MNLLSTAVEGKLRELNKQTHSIGGNKMGTSVKELGRQASVMEQVFLINREIVLMKGKRDVIIIKELRRRKISYTVFDSEYKEATIGR